jgi:hypothetical protein
VYVTSHINADWRNKSILIHNGWARLVPLQLEEHKMGKKVEALDAVALGSQWTSAYKDGVGETGWWYIGVDKASHMCRKLCTDNVYCAPKGQKLHEIVKFWRLYCHRVQWTNHIGWSYHRRVRHKAILMGEVTTSSMVKIVQRYRLVRLEWR